jgi:branched-chain amino acid aminotransferase
MGKAHGGEALTFVDGQWQAGNPKILTARSHAVWLSSVVFDGARAFGGVAPDLDRHCARAVASARILGLKPTMTGAAELYICPMFFAEEGFVVPDADSTRFVLSIYESPLPSPTGFSACRSSYRRPAKDMAPTEAKASCLYPNVARIGREAKDRGFDTAVVHDPNGNVAEFAYSNLFMVKDGVVHTPAANGTFLNGITRQRVIGLLREAGFEVVERAIDFVELLTANEVFATGNYAKVQPCVRIEDVELRPGPLYAKARELYFEFARSSRTPIREPVAPQ